VSGGEKDWWKDELWDVCVCVYVCLCVFTIPELKSVTVAKILIRAQTRNDGKKNWVRREAQSFVVPKESTKFQMEKTSKSGKVVLSWEL